MSILNQLKLNSMSNTNNQLEQWLNRESDILIQKARHMGIESGKTNTPPVHAPQLAPYIYPLKVGFKAIWRNLQSMLHEKKIKTLGDIDFERQSNEARNTDEQIRDIGNQIKVVRDKLDRVSNDGFNWMVYLIILMVYSFLLFYEARMNSGFLMQIAPDISVRDARMISFFLYVAITICLMGVHYAAGFIYSRFWKKVLIVFSYGTISLLLVGMAYLRCLYVNNGEFVLLSFIFFAIVNLAFLAALSFLHSFSPTRLQFSNFLSRMVYSWKLDRLKSKLKRLNEKYTAHRKSGEDIVRNTQESIHSINHYKSLLQSKYEYCLSEFTVFNISTRTDGIVPLILNDIESQKIDFE